MTPRPGTVVTEQDSAAAAEHDSAAAAEHDSAAAAIEQLSEDRVLVTAGGRRFVIPATCPHRGGRLVHAHLSANALRITCPLHRSTYDLATGCQIAGPDADPLLVTEWTPESST